MATSRQRIEAHVTEGDVVRHSLVDQQGAPLADGLSELVRELTLPQRWSVPMADIVGNPQVRLDAEHYDPAVIENKKILKGLHCDLVPLSDMADIYLPSMFTRIWASGSEFGVRYVNATDMMSYYALGRVAQDRYLSYASQVNIQTLLIDSSMIILTCSGTLGRVFDVPAGLSGSAGTHDLIRIIPRDPKFRGFLRIYLETSLAQVQILSHTHGGQIDHITSEQVATCLVPVPQLDIVHSISDVADRCARVRSRSLSDAHKAKMQLLEAIGSE